MTPKQRLQVEQSEKRQKVNDLLAKDELTDEERAELETLTKRLQEIEPELRAAIVAEGEDEARARGAFGNQDGEAGERGRLLRETSVSEYLRPAAGGGAIEGRAAELNAALDLPAIGSNGIVMPLELLTTPELRGGGGARVETRAATTTAQNDGGEMQRPILRRLFGRSVLAALGARIDSVPAGRVEWPLLNNGVAPVQKAEGEAAPDAIAASFNFANLKPKRLTGQYEYTHEVAASVGMIEEALRRDLADSIQAQMSNGALNGDGAGANVQGLLDNDILALPAVPGEVVDPSTTLGLSGIAVDGIHAESSGECTILFGVESYQKVTRLQSTSGDGPIYERLRTRTAAIMATSYIASPPAATARANVQDCIVHAGMSEERGDSVIAMWPTLEIVRDQFTKASTGVVLTFVALWDARMGFRSGAYKRVALKLK